MNLTFIPHNTLLFVWNRTMQFVLVVFMMLFSLSIYAQTLKPNTYQTNGPVNALFNNGTNLYAGGQFSEAYKATGSAVKTNLTTGVPTAVLPPVKLNNGTGTIQIMISDGGSGWYIGGLFDQVGSLGRTNLAHLLSDLTVDPDFNCALNGTITDLALAPSGLYLAGSFTLVNGQSRPYLAQVANTGALTSFAPITPNQPVKKLLLVGSELFAGGEFTYLGSRGQNAVLSSLTDHSAGALLPAVNGTIYASVPDGSGGYYIGGNFTQIGGVTRTYLARVNASGQVDQTFAKPSYPWSAD